MKEIKTFEDACKSLGLDPSNVIPDFSLFPEKDRKAMIAHCKLVIICDALNRSENEGKEYIPDWESWDEIKYYPWFDLASSGFRFDVYADWNADSVFGSRLCFKSRELAEYAGKIFLEEYKKYMLINK